MPCELNNVPDICDYAYELSPSCNIDLFISTRMNTNTVSYHLGLKKNFVLFENIPYNVETLILGLPIIMFHDCKLYTIDVIPDTTNINNYINVTNTINSEILDITSQYQLNGYQYIEIDITKYNSCLPSTCDLKFDLKLIFDVFCLPLTSKNVYTKHAIKYHPMIWIYTCVTEEIVNDAPPPQSLVQDPLVSVDPLPP